LGFGRLVTWLGRLLCLWAVLGCSASASPLLVRARIGLWPWLASRLASSCELARLGSGFLRACETGSARLAGSSRASSSLPEPQRARAGSPSPSFFSSPTLNPSEGPAFEPLISRGARGPFPSRRRIPFGVSPFLVLVVRERKRKKGKDTKSNDVAHLF
jgi:hypothetical protein